MESELREIILRVAESNKEGFALDADLAEELDVDSHRVIELAFEIEKSFGISIPTDRFGELRTLRGAMALVTALKK